MFTSVVALLAAYFIYPAYSEQDKAGRLFIALFAPLIVVVLKGISRTAEDKPSGNFIRAFVSAVLRVSGIVKAFTIGSKQFGIRCADWLNTRCCWSHRTQHNGFD